MNNDNQPPGDGSDAAALRIESELRDRYGLLLKTSEVAEVLRLSAASILQIPGSSFREVTAEALVPGFLRPMWRPM